MKHNKYIAFFILFIVALTFSCRDESLYPLPYASKEFGGYLRIYRVSTNVFDVNDIANSAFEVVYEAVDEKNGDNLQEIEFWISHRRGTSLTDEVLLKKIPGTDFAAVPQPTISVWKRATIRLTAAEILATLQTLTTDPDGACATCSPVGGLVAFPGGYAAADQVVIRWVMVLKDGKRFSVMNPQSTVNAAFAKTAEANTTPNITGGQFYNAPFIFTITARALTAVSWVGDYTLTQNTLWSANHSWNQHADYPTAMIETLFPNQTVTLAKVPGGLSTERQFSVQYKGQAATMRINLENGTVFIPLQNSGVNCVTNRPFYWTNPPAGNFTLGSVGPLKPGLPQATTANRGAYAAASDGLTTGNTMTIGVDDDCDEYGLRNGYCNWTRRVKLTLTKI